MNIFITEDERLIAEDLRYTLQSKGFNVIGTATSGEDALEQCNCCKPDLVIMDIILEGEISGIETARMLYEKYGIPVIFMSANSDERTMREVENIKNYGFINKPFTESELDEIMIRIRESI